MGQAYFEKQIQQAAEILSLTKQSLRAILKEKMPEEDLKLREIRAAFGDVDASMYAERTSAVTIAAGMCLTSLIFFGGMIAYRGLVPMRRHYSSPLLPINSRPFIRKSIDTLKYSDILLSISISGLRLPFS